MLIHAAEKLTLTKWGLARPARVVRNRCPKQGAQFRTLTLRKGLYPSRTFASASSVTENTEQWQSAPQESNDDVRCILDTCRKLGESIGEDRSDVQVVHAQALLERRPKNIINVTVCSSAHGTGADFVSALLDDPLSSDSTLRPTLLERWSRVDRQKMSILTSSVSDGASPFLTRFQGQGILIEVTEVERSSSLSHTFSYFASAEIPILVLSPSDLNSFSITSELSIIDVLRYNTHSLIVIDGPLSADSPAIEKFKIDLCASTGITSDRVLVCDSSRALRGASALAKDGPTVPAVRRFQEDVSFSNISNVSNRLSTLAALGPESLRSMTSQALVKSSVNYAGTAVERARNSFRLLRDTSSDVMEKVLEERERAVVSILGSDPDVSASREKGRIAQGMDQVASEIRSVVDGMSWTKLPFVVDDVSSRVDSAVEHALTRQFGNELMFQTGRLASLQEKYRTLAESELGSIVSDYRTPLIENKIDQITSAPSYRITATSHSPLTSPSGFPSSSPPALLAPLQQRCLQLSHATRALHVSAQRALLVSFGSAAVSFTSGASLCAYGIFDIPSGIAAGTLGALLSLRWAVGSWTKARRRWWGAFNRVGEGLERDLGDAIKAILDQHVLVVPLEECAEMSKYADKKEKEIAAADEFIKTMEEKYSVERRHDALHTIS